MGLREWGICQREVYWLVSGLEIWPYPLRARPVIMSDILDGLRSYPLFMYSQVWNLGQPFFFPPSRKLGLMVLVPEDFEWKISRNPVCFVSAVFSCFCFLKREKKNSILSVSLFRPRCSFIAIYFIHTQITFTWIFIFLFFFTLLSILTAHRKCQASDLYKHKQNCIHNCQVL